MLDKRIAMSDPLPIVGTEDGVAPRGLVFDSFHIWPIGEIFTGEIGDKRFVPNIGDSVVDRVNNELYKVTAVDENTYLSTLLLVEYSETPVKALNKLNILSDIEHSLLFLKYPGEQGHEFAITYPIHDDIPNAHHVNIYDDLVPYQEPVLFLENLLLNETIVNGTTVKTVDVENHFITATLETDEMVSMVIFDEDNTVLAKQRLRVLNEVVSPPEVIMYGDESITLDVLSTAPELFIQGENPLYIYTADKSVYFHLVENNTITDHLRDLIVDTANTHFYLEEDLVSYIESRGVTLEKVSVTASYTDDDLGFDYLYQKVKTYTITKGGHTGTIKIYETVFNTYVEQGALAYDYQGNPLTPTISGNTDSLSGSYLVSYQVTDNDQTVSKTREVRVIKDPRIHVSIRVNPGYAIYKYTGELTVIFPVGEDPLDYVITWEQLDLGNDAAIATIDDNTLPTINITSTDYLTKKFRVYLNKGLDSESYTDAFFYHSPVEEASLKITSGEATLRTDYTDTLPSESVNNWVGTGLGIEQPRTIYQLEPMALNDHTVVIVGSPPSSMYGSIKKTIIERKIGEDWHSVVEYTGFKKEIYGLLFETTYRIRYTGNYRGQKINIIARINPPSSAKGMADTATLRIGVGANVKQVSVEQTTLRTLPYGESSSLVIGTGVTPAVMSDLNLQTLRELPQLNEPTSLRIHTGTTPAVLISVEQTDNTNIG